MRLNVKDKMAEKSLNKNQFSKLVKIGYPAACAIYEGETTRISFDTLESICLVLECTPNDILVSDNQQFNRLLTYYEELQNMQNTQ